MAEGSMYIEKRKHKRVEKLVFVNYKLMPKENLIEPIKKDGQTKDLSLGGIRIEGEPVGQPGDVIKIDFVIGDDGGPITTFAEIKWIRESEDLKQFGVEFLTLKEDDRKRIEAMTGE